jgi:hypothetical protein
VRKTIIRPNWWTGSAEGGGATGPGGGALGQAIHRPGGLAVTLSGIGIPGPDVETEAREALSVVRRVVCDDLCGELDDVTRLRASIQAESLAAGRTALQRVCTQTFEWPANPAVTVVGVAAVSGEATLELEADAFVPDDGWEFDVIDGE